jgi:hypothetical protein
VQLQESITQQRQVRLNARIQSLIAKATAIVT